MQRSLILGVPFDPVTMDQAVQRMLAMLQASGQSHVMTPNAEMLVASCNDLSFRGVLAATALNVADGIGVVWASRLLRCPLPERVAGVDLVGRLAGVIPQAHSVFLLGAAPGIAEKAGEALRRDYPGLKIAGVASGSPSDVDTPGIIDAIRSSGATLLLVAYGAPAQDLWIARHLESLPSVRVAMGVGGTFDFLAGVRLRAPSWMRFFGLEWLWRLLIEPRRIGRIFTAVVRFPLLVARYGTRAPAH